jgi:hypothetical protein
MLSLNYPACVGVSPSDQQTVGMQIIVPFVYQHEPSPQSSLVLSCRICIFPSETCPKLSDASKHSSCLTKSRLRLPPTGPKTTPWSPLRTVRLRKSTRGRSSSFRPCQTRRLPSTTRATIPVLCRRMFLTFVSSSRPMSISFLKRNPENQVAAAVFQKWKQHRRRLIRIFRIKRVYSLGFLASKITRVAPEPLMMQRRQSVRKYVRLDVGGIE